LCLRATSLLPKEEVGIAILFGFCNEL
jgi:hypothetical protein